MIIGGGKRAYWRKFAPHLMKTENGQQQVRVVEIRGLAADNVGDAFQELEELGRGTRAKNFYYHANIDPRADEHMTEEQWEYAVDTLEKNLGFEGQPRFIVEHHHEDDGRTHRHVVWSRVDTDRMRVIPNDWDYSIHQRTADALEKKFGHEATPRTRDKGKPKGPDNYEYVRGKESKINPKEVEAEITALWHQCDSGQALAAAIEERGYILAEGDRGLCIVDSAAHGHSVARRAGVRVKDVDARMADTDRENLPTLPEARALARQRAAERKERDEAQPADPDKRRDDAKAYELIADELAEAARDAMNAKGRQHGDDGPPKAEAAAPEAKEDHVPGSEPYDSGPAAEPPPSDPSAEASPAPNTASHDPEPPSDPSPGRESSVPYTGASGPEPEPSSSSAAPATALQPTLFARLAQRLTSAIHALDGGQTVAEAADLSAVKAAPSRDGVPLPPWEIPPPDRGAAGSTSTPFERLASELVRDAKEAPPVLGDLAIVATAVAVREPPLEFARLTQELTRDAAPVARTLAVAAEPELSPFERVTRERFAALREAGGDGLFFAEGLTWLARKLDAPPDVPPQESALTPFERVTRELHQACRNNGGAPEPGFWERGVAILASTRDRVLEWARKSAQSFVDRIARNRNSEHDKPGMDR